MAMNRRMSIALIAVAGTLLPQLAQPKGTTVGLSIAGPGISAPLYTSEPALIAANVWGGGYADWEAGPIGTLDSELPYYQIYFWTQPRLDNVQINYVIRYRWEENANRAVVCLPGLRDPWYYVNVANIIMEDRDGNCFWASEAWGKAVKDLLPQ
jgi:hypothetical protein